MVCLQVTDLPFCQSINTYLGKSALFSRSVSKYAKATALKKQFPSPRVRLNSLYLLLRSCVQYTV